MPTASDRARSESGRWIQLADNWRNDAVTELSVTAVHDPRADLKRRGTAWGFEFEDFTLSEISRFAAGLAAAEASAWESARFDIAARGYEDRRFLIGDRLVHWAVPWLASMAFGGGGACDLAAKDMKFLLELGDHMRLAPETPGREGILVEGEDSFGPLDLEGSIWSGWVDTESAPPGDVAAYWAKTGNRHPGTAQLWFDLAVRSKPD